MSPPIQLTPAGVHITPPPNLTLRGIVAVPGDKSISHRALIFGCLAQGTTTITGILPSADPQSTAQCLRDLGHDITPLTDGEVRVQPGEWQEPQQVLDCGNSGTTMRLLLGLLAGRAGQFFSLTGDDSLRGRPMQRVITPLSQMGAQIWGRKGGTRAPLAVQGQLLQPIAYDSPIASAQVKSAILLAGLGCEGMTQVQEPAPSRDHTERMLRAFGAQITWKNGTVQLQGGAQLRGQTVVVPGDMSSAAFWLVAGAITPGADIMLTNVGVNPSRTGILEVLEAMGARITCHNQRLVAGEPLADIQVQHSALEGVAVGGALIPRLIDEIPILTVAAAFAQGKTVIRDAAELRVKESDRLTAMATQLTRLGARVEEYPDGLTIHGSQQPLVGTELHTYDDHRIAMALAIAALNAQGASYLSPGGCVQISYPQFWQTLQQLCQPSP
ncbi:3-phosphoshikimate 1-carboxyvinyltransferase [Gloeomargarita lithophora Alchichica-D10]|uniref:3-phosphoshikimate 1-carboxyvinyltransferase n=1 Tax=Gloeomargarita lithophora Alchichica-D10 TaxID=1188229 RepID=A0A1J0AD12_9CYAN|nr:3-phosphoshikimate 1-carboxyvinyltransferase [Gloeomargarita lithophora]APB33826.1 3-phosphoshikimate 1-carboxyvinyltransferase [Gloeomargarita lithophora Alchichica-D10]